MPSRASLLAGGFCLILATAQAAGLKQFNDDGAWNWFQDERVIVAQGRLLIGSVASGSHDPSRAGNIELVSYDLETGKTVRVALHQPSGPEQTKRWLNDHCAPALVARPDGGIVAMYSLHSAGNELFYRCARTAADPSSWETEQVFIPGPDARITFPNLQFLSAGNSGGGRIYSFFRGLDKAQMPSWAFSDSGGEKWSPGGVFLRAAPGSPRIPYVKYCSDGHDTVHMIYTDGHHLDYGNGLYHVSLRGAQLQRSDGTGIRPLRDGLRSPDEGTLIFRANAQSVAWVHDVHLDTRGRPFVAYSVQRNSANLPGPERGEDHRYRYARWTGTHWLDYEIAFGGSRIHTFMDGDDCTGLVALDPQDPDVLYISTNAAPTTGKPLISHADQQRHWEIFRGVTRNGGAAWTWTPVTHDSTVDNIRPIVPVWKGHRGVVVWLQGQMRNYTDYNLAVVGLFFDRLR